MEDKKKVPKVGRLKVPSPKVIKSKKMYNRKNQNNNTKREGAACKD